MFKLPENTLTRFSLLFATLSLAACGGGGGSSDGGSDLATDYGSGSGTVATAVKPGIYVSTITYDSGAADQEARTLLSSSGKYAIFTNTLAGTFGTLTFRSDDTFSDDNGTYVFFDETWQPFDGSLEGGSITSEEFTATFTADTGEPGIGSDITGIRFNELSDQGVTKLELNETYYLGADQATAVTVHADGSVTGSTDTGCTINGAISIPDPAYNIFEGNLMFTGCADIDGASSDQRNGDYQIVGYLRIFQEGAKRLVFAGTNGQVLSLFSGAN